MSALSCRSITSLGQVTQRNARPSPAMSIQNTRRHTVSVRALLGPDGKPGTTSGSKQKKLVREEEPEQYWSTKAEADGNVMKDPLAVIGILAILFPFLFLMVAIGTGAIDTSVYR